MSQISAGTEQMGVFTLNRGVKWLHNVWYVCVGFIWVQKLFFLDSLHFDFLSTTIFKWISSVF